MGVAKECNEKIWRSANFLKLVRFFRKLQIAKFKLISLLCVLVVAYKHFKKIGFRKKSVLEPVHMILFVKSF